MDDLMIPADDSLVPEDDDLDLDIDGKKKGKFEDPNLESLDDLADDEEEDEEEDDTVETDDFDN